MYKEMGKTAKMLKVAGGGNIWSGGVFRFQRPMEGKFKADLYVTPVDEDQNNGCILQIIY